MDTPDIKAKKALFNPLSEDFSYEWLDDDNKPHTLTIPSIELVYFPPSQYEFMKKHLCDAILNERGTKPNYEAALAQVIKEVEVDL